MIIIKFGGSLITDKSKECVYKNQVTQQLLNELRKVNDEMKINKKQKAASSKTERDYDMILVHGAGSFGHILAEKFQLAEGYKEPSQIMGLSQVHRDVRDLNLKFMNDLLNCGFPGISLPPMVILRNRARLLAYIDSELFTKVLDMSCIPVTFGDVVHDDTYGFSICSGDSIIKKLSIIFKPEKVIFLTDVDGLFTTNPVLESTAELITELTKRSFSSATTENINPDVTGGIFLKAKIALDLAKMGVKSYIINGKVPGRLSSALLGEDVIGTVAER